MIFIAAAGLVWEFARMPLDTLWDTGTAAEIVFAAEHYAGGDVLIAIGAVISELFLDGNPTWPDTRRPHVIALTVAFGFPARQSANGATSRCGKPGPAASWCQSFPSSTRVAAPFCNGSPYHRSLSAPPCRSHRSK
jgi:hypothetical protein